MFIVFVRHWIDGSNNLIGPVIWLVADRYFVRHGGDQIKRPIVAPDTMQSYAVAAGEW